MRHVEKALKEYFDKHGETGFIQIENCDDDDNVAPIVKFTIQSAPIGDVGVNGVQCADMIRYSLYLLKSLNKTFPCRENSLSITKMEEALHWQEARTRDRTTRGVEGKNED